MYIPQHPCLFTRPDIVPMEQILPFLFFLVIGLILKLSTVFPENTDRCLNLYVIYVALPALILLQIPNLQFSHDALIPILMPWAVLPVSGLMVILLSRVMHWSRETTGALLLVVPLGNTSFLGIPMTEQFFGSAGVRYAVLYDQFGSFLALSTYGSIILAIYGNREKRNIILQVIFKIISFPPFIALIAALFLPMDKFLQISQPSLTMAAESLMPVVLVAIGFQTRLFLPFRDLTPFASGLLIRLIITPCLFIVACRMLGLTGTPVQVALFETAMPPMVTAAAMASIAGLKPALTSAMVGIGLFISLFTLPLIYQWIQ